MPATYVIEGNIEELDICALDKQDLHDEMARLEIQLGFTVHRSPSLRAHRRYLQGLDAYLRDDLRRKTVDDVLQTRWLIEILFNRWVSTRSSGI